VYDVAHSYTCQYDVRPRGTSEVVGPNPSSRKVAVMKKAMLIAGLIPLCGWAASDAGTAPAWSPSRSVRVIVPFQAGGPMDTVARTIAQQFGEKWGQTFVVENRTGGSGNVGSNVVAKAPPDGYTLGMASGGTHGANSTLFGPKCPMTRSEISRRCRCWCI
jgi:tripartite-type tricarboxylate transporter receptor subunit TctC